MKKWASPRKTVPHPKREPHKALDLEDESQSVMLYDQSLKDLEGYLDSRPNLTADTVPVKDLKVQFNEGSKRFTIKQKLKEYSLAPSGVESLAHNLGIPVSYFRHYPDPGEFAEHANRLLQDGGNGSVMLRRHKSDVRGVCPQGYKVMDDYRVFELMWNLVKNLEGLEIDISGNQRATRYNLRFGNPKNDYDKTYKMINITNSETNLHWLDMEGGLFRTLCSNSAILDPKSYGGVSWNHQGRDGIKNKILAEAAKVINKLPAVEGKFEDSRKMELKYSGREHLNILADQRRIPGTFVKTVMKSMTSDIRCARSQFDIVNVLTKGAQQLPIFGGQRRRVEKASVDILFDRSFPATRRKKIVVPSNPNTPGGFGRI
jgi:hypothetical protein